MTDHNQQPPEEGGYNPTVEDLLVLALNGADIEFLVVTLDDGRTITLEWMKNDVVSWLMTDGIRTMREIVRVFDDGSVAETLSHEWLS